jgi:hypothetical protein
MHNLMMVAKQHWNAITSDGAALFCCDALCLEMCRFSDAGNDDLTTRSGGRRPKSAKARNRVGG